MIDASPRLLAASHSATIVAIAFGDAVSALTLTCNSAQAKRAVALRSPSVAQWVVRLIRDDS